MIEPVAPARQFRPAQAVAIGEATVAGPGGLLAALGLGSCVGLTAWDPLTRIGGMAHFMLPSGTRAGNPAKYVDTGLPWFLAALAAAGASIRRCQFKAAGGAAMFIGVSGSLEVGKRNVAALGEALAAAGQRLLASDVGGSIGRSIELDLGTGLLSIRTIHGTSIL
jgi:chemotaxis protein CheD